eukprot:313699-Chlamydomonas_euryale.AAC.1
MSGLRQRHCQHALVMCSHGRGGRRVEEGWKDGGYKGIRHVSGLPQNTSLFQVPKHVPVPGP